jgi:hypothetical protein
MFSIKDVFLTHCGLLLAVVENPANTTTSLKAAKTTPGGTPDAFVCKRVARLEELRLRVL